MTKDKLLARFSLLRQEREQLVARVQMYDGALEEAEYWLGQAEAEEAAIPPPEEPPE